MIKVIQAIAAALTVAGAANMSAWQTWDPNRVPGAAIIMICAGLIIYVIAEFERAR
jgi:hypothetical protein